MFVQKKTDPAVARRELQRNAGLFLAAVALIRVSPYVLEFFQKQSS